MYQIWYFPDIQICSFHLQVISVTVLSAEAKGTALGQRVVTMQSFVSSPFPVEKKFRCAEQIHKVMTGGGESGNDSGAQMAHCRSETTERETELSVTPHIPSHQKTLTAQSMKYDLVNSHI